MKYFLTLVFSLLLTSLFSETPKNLYFLKKIKNVEVFKRGFGSSVEKESFPVFSYQVKNEKNGKIVKNSLSPIYCSLKSLSKPWQQILMGMQKKEIRKIWLDENHSLEVKLLYPHVNAHEFPLPSILIRRNLE